MARSLQHWDFSFFASRPPRKCNCQKALKPRTTSFLKVMREPTTNAKALIPHRSMSISRPNTASFARGVRTYCCGKTVENDLAHCLGRRAHGIHVIYLPRKIHVIYLPRKGYAGPDKVRYTVKFPTTQHTVEVNLTVLPDDLQSRNAVPADISAPIGDSAQKPGPLPVCAALVS